MTPLQDIPPSDWFNGTKANKFPYFPQKDDDVYYLPYGHQLYKEQVMRTRLYNQSNQNQSIREHKYDKISAKVAKIDFLFKECRDQTVIRLLYITLRPYNTDIFGNIIHVKYHHMSGVDDFIVLKEHYEAGIAYEWQIGERFRSPVADNWRYGTVIGYNEENFCQQTLFKKYRIQWYSDCSLDWLSPWNMDPLPIRGMAFPLYEPIITDDDRRNFFRRHPEEWPRLDEDKELRRLSKG